MDCFADICIFSNALGYCVANGFAHAKLSATQPRRPSNSLLNPVNQDKIPLKQAIVVERKAFVTESFGRDPIKRRQDEVHSTITALNSSNRGHSGNTALSNTMQLPPLRHQKGSGHQIPQKVANKFCLPRSHLIQNSPVAQGSPWSQPKPQSPYSSSYSSSWPLRPQTPQSTIQSLPQHPSQLPHHRSNQWLW